MMICKRAGTCPKSASTKTGNDCRHAIPHTYDEYCDSFEGKECNHSLCAPAKKGVFGMKDKAKKVADELYTYIKPYEKWIGLVALAACIDHFLLGNKFMDRFKAIGEGLVKKITSGLDKLIEKLEV